MSEVLVFSNNSKCRWVWKTTGRKVSDLRNRSKDSQPRAEMWNNLLDWRSSGAEAESVAQEWIYNYFWKGEECVRYSPGFWWAERRPEVSGLLVDVKIRWELRNCSASVVCRKLGWFWWKKKKKGVEMAIKPKIFQNAEANKAEDTPQRNWTGSEKHKNGLARISQHLKASAKHKAVIAAQDTSADHGWPLEICRGKFPDK